MSELLDQEVEVLPGGVLPKWTLPLLVAIPAAAVLDAVGGSQVIVFIAAALALIPCSAVMGRATEHLAARSGPGIGGLLNVTFGNAPELIIALVALSQGYSELVKASLVGSVLGNVLLVLGASMFAGGIHSKRRNSEQEFSRTAAGAQSGMLLVAVATLVLPAVWELASPTGEGLPKVAEEAHIYSGDVLTLSWIVAAILISTYAAGMIFSLFTHRDVFNPVQGHVVGAWKVGKAVLLLAIAGAFVGWMSELLVGSLHEATSSIGASEFFIGAVVVAIVGNAAEHWVAVAVAWKDQMSLAINISIGSAAQIALFVAPLVALCSLFIGPHSMPLVFNGYELAALLLSAVIAAVATSRGRSTWFEGLQLIALYAVFAVLFWFAA
jgi:Ca2+:H+ antiporter